MAHNVDIGGVTYVSASDAGSKVGYTSDYVARLAREQKILAKQIGRQWFVDPISLENFYSDANRKKKQLQEKLRKVRVAERREKAVASSAAASQLVGREPTPSVVEAMQNASVPSAFVKSAGVMVAGLFAGIVFYGTGTGALPASVTTSLSQSATQSALALGSFFRGDFSLFTFGDQEAVEAHDEERVELAERAGQKKEAGEREVAEKTEEKKQGSQQAAAFTSEGIVLIEDNEMADEEIESLKRSFSDEVLITRDPNDPQTGVVTPVFKNRTDERYRFLLVPVAEGSGP